MNENINVVLASDNNYMQHAAVTIVSILVNTKKKERLEFFLLEDNVDEVSKIQLKKTVEGLRAKITFIKVEQSDKKAIFVSGHITRAAYLRLGMADILPQAIDKVIYLDCDLLVLDDIENLWNFDMQGKPLAAVEDFGILSSKGKRRNKIENLGWDRHYSYFNSGVLLLNLEEWRRFSYSHKLIELVKQNSYRHHDQDALNFLFKGNWTKIDLRWNVIPPVYNMGLRVLWDKKMRRAAAEALKDVAVIHYAGGYKPWEYPLHQGFNEKYYEYLALTDFKNAKMPQPNPKKRNHSITRELLRLKWAQLVRTVIGLTEKA